MEYVENRREDEKQFKKNAILTVRANLESETFPKLIVGKRKNNLGIFISKMWKKYGLVCRYNLSAMTDLINSVKKTVDH